MSVICAEFYPFLFQLVVRKGTRDEQMFNLEIGRLIGKQLLNDYDYIHEPELVAFRKNILSVCREAVTARQKGSHEAAAQHRFPPSLVTTAFPQHLVNKLKKDQIMIIVCVGAELESK